jgi:His/Glu/Gln/Arg/opine family amino acid ABC transporter permease subunit
LSRWRTILTGPIAALVVLGFAVLAYRAYAPGDLGTRVDRLQARWSIFTQWQVWRALGRALVTTLELAIVSIVLSLVFAVVLALIRLAPHPRMRAPLPGAAIIARAAGLLVEVVRSSPLFMLIIYTFIALPKLGIDLSPFWAGVTALTLYTSCVTSEIVRAGILSLERGQFDAALSLGLSYTRRVRFVVLPQALRRMVPAIVSQLVTLIKDTSLVAFITVYELTRLGQGILQQENNPIETYIVLMAIYFAVNFSLSQFSVRLELRPGRVGRAKAPAALGAEDQIPSVA